MPEEINRVVTDRLSDLLFTPSRDGDQNLQSEGVPRERIHFVGNVMIDSLVLAQPRARSLNAAGRRGLTPGAFAVVTLHRPSNVDHARSLADLLAALAEIAREHPVLFPVHPRTRQRIAEFGLLQPEGAGLTLCDPIGYVEMLSLVSAAGLVITDSGGLQEETTFLGVPCLTVRPNTERPVTVSQGTNTLVPPDRVAIVAAARRAFGVRPAVAAIERWDGRAAERIAEVICEGAEYR
jgi:UDP-N-acetylglucosamine 2-epimerase (non-hydrolysing)